MVLSAYAIESSRKAFEEQESAFASKAVFVEMRLRQVRAPESQRHASVTPRFSVRGLQPFHDFPMGPDFWQPQFWRALATNMGKMKMNFYPKLAMENKDHDGNRDTQIVVL